MKHIFIAVMMLMALGSGMAHAQSWPSKPVRVIVSQAPGAAPDIICRYLMERLSRALGQPIVVDNRPGGVNVIGTQAAARATPDGYTFLFATSAALVTNPFTIKGLPYDSLKDFAPVAMVAKGGFVLAANAEFPVKNFAELLAYDKAQPGKLSIAIDGPRNASGMLAAYMNKVMGTNFTPVAYQNIIQGVQDTVGGRTQITIQAPVVIDAFVKKGSLRPLAVSSGRRYPSLPGVPTMAESFPGFELVGWFMLVAPTGTPGDAIQRANREMDRILKEPEVQQRLSEFAFFTDGAETTQALGQFLRSETALWNKLVNSIGILPE